MSDEIIRRWSEDAIIGCLLLYPDDFIVLSSDIDVEMFADKRNAESFKWFESKHKHGEKWDLVIFCDAFEKEFGFDHIDHFCRVGTIPYFDEYVQNVRIKHLARQLLKEGMKAERLDVEAMRAAVEDFYLKGQGIEQIKISEIAEEVLSKIENPGAEVEIPTIYSDFNERVGGFKRGELYVIGANTGMSKSFFLSNLLEKPLRDKFKVSMVDYEMKPAQQIERFSSIFFNVPLNWIQKNRTTRFKPLSVDQRLAAASAVQSTCDMVKDNLKILKYLTMAQIEIELIKNKPDILTIDTFQVFCTDQKKPRNTDGLQHLEDLIRRLRIMAEKYNVCVVVISQTNVRDNTIMPESGHMKGAGAIEENASAVITVRDSEKAFPGNPERIGKFEVAYRKARFGGEGIKTLYKNKHTGKISAAKIEPSAEDCESMENQL